MSRKTHDSYAFVDGYEKGNAFARISEQQILSPTYQSLSDGAKHVLSVCKICRKYYKGTDKQGKSKAIDGNVLYFYFNREIQKRFGLNNPNRVREELIELVKKGFLDVVECNAHARKKNVYSFSSKWAALDKGEDIKLSAAARAFIQGKKKTK